MPWPNASSLACRLAPTETLGQPMVFLLQRGLRDQELERRPDLEQPAIQSDANPS
jgi:hypothetical protein